MNREPGKLKTGQGSILKMVLEELLLSVPENAGRKGAA